MEDGPYWSMSQEGNSTRLETVQLGAPYVHAALATSGAPPVGYTSLDEVDSTKVAGGIQNAKPGPIKLGQATEESKAAVSSDNNLSVKPKTLNEVNVWLGS